MPAGCWYRKGRVYMEHIVKIVVIAVLTAVASALSKDDN